MKTHDLHVRLRVDTSEFDQAMRRVQRVLGCTRRMSRPAWFIAWVRWRLTRPAFVADGLWKTRHTLWLTRRPRRSGRSLSGFERSLMGLLVLTVGYLAAHVVAWL